LSSAPTTIIRISPAGSMGHQLVVDDDDFRVRDAQHRRQADGVHLSDQGDARNRRDEARERRAPRPGEVCEQDALVFVSCLALHAKRFVPAGA
jgi:hypothetical protein